MLRALFINAKILTVLLKKMRFCFQNKYHNEQSVLTRMRNSIINLNITSNKC